MADKEAKPGSDAPFNLPRRVGNYEVVSKIGEGGMGSVYKARHAQLESFAAVKFLTPSLAQNEVFVKRFEREARLAAQLTSPFSIRTFDVGDVEGVRFILMEYVEGESLSKTLERRGKLPEKEAIPIILNVAQALQEAHEMGIIHRDIKPENIMINRRGIPKLADLGIAKQLTQTDQNLTMTGFAIGTPSFMSPEQAQGLVDVDTRSDIYSLGATLYRMVVGALPFNGPTPLSVMHRIATEPPPNPAKINPSLSPLLSNLICKMMATRREDRYQTIGEVIRQLESIRSGESATTSVEQKQTTSIVSVAGLNTAGGTPSPVSATAATNAGFLGSTKAAADRKRKILVAAAIGGVVVVLGAVVGYVALKGGASTPTTTVAVVPTTLETPPATTAPQTPQTTQAPPATRPAHPPATAPATTPAVPVTTLPPAPVTTARTVPPPTTTLPPPTTTLPKPPTTTLPPNYTPQVTAVLANVKAQDWVGAVEAADQLNRLSKNLAAHVKLLAAAKAGVQASDERGKARNLFQGKVSPDFEAADARLGDAQKRLVELDPSKIDAAPLDALAADLNGARDAFTKVIKAEIEKASVAQKVALETTAALNAARNGDWKAASDAVDRAAALAGNQPVQKKLQTVVAAGAQASGARAKAAQQLSVEARASDAYAAVETRYRGTLDKLGALDAAKLDPAQLDAALTALGETQGAYQKLIDDARRQAELAAQQERELRAKVAAVLTNVRDKDWVGASDAARQLSKTSPTHAKLASAVTAGVQTGDEREKARKFFTGKVSPEFEAADARFADVQKRLATLDAAKLDPAALDALAADLAGARDAFRQVGEGEMAKANQAQKIAAETTAVLTAARNGDWRSASDAADRALALARQPAQQKLKDVTTAGTHTAAARAEATQAMSADARTGDAFTGAEARYRALLERLGALDASRLEPAQLDPTLAALDEMTKAYRKLLDDARKQAELAVQSARDLRAGLAAAREGEWKTFADSVTRTSAASGNPAAYQKLRTVAENGSQTSAARASAMGFAVEGKPPSTLIGPDTRFADVRERIGALNPAAIDPAAVDRINADLQDCRDQFRKAAEDAFTAAYPNLQKPIQGTNLVKGFLELYDAKQRCPDLPAVVDLVSKYDPRGECLAIIGAMSRVRTQAKDYPNPAEAAQVAKALDDAVSRCDRLATDPFYKEKVAVLRRRVLQARVVANEAAGNPAGMLADAWILQQGGEESAAALVSRAQQVFIDKTAAGMDGDRKALVRMLELAGAELGPEALAPARKALTDAMAASKAAPRLFGDAALTRVWMQQIGPISPAGMVRVPPGSFPLGEHYKGSVALTPPSSPEHSVPIAVFYIDATEVTNAQYQQFVDAGGYANDAYWTAAKDVDRAAFVDATGKPGPVRWQNGRFPEGEDKMPVAGVSWYEAMAYAAWAGKALPTEAQWECAAVGTPPKEANGAYSDSVYPWGDKWVKSRAQVDDARSLPVGSKPEDKSPVGCLDMTGNVREWTSSLYEKYPDSVSRDRELGAGLAVVRGASYKESSLNAQPVLRRARTKETRDDRIGFRCVWIPPAP